MFARFRPLRPYLARYKARYITGFACLIVGYSVGAVVPLVIKAGVDDLTHHVLMRRLAMVGGLLIGLSLIKAVLQFWTRWILIGISRDAESAQPSDLRQSGFRCFGWARRVRGYHHPTQLRRHWHRLLAAPSVHAAPGVLSGEAASLRQSRERD